MFSLSTSFQPQQMVVPFSQVINALHSLKNSATASVQTLHKDFSHEPSSYLKEPSVSLRDLGLSEVGVSQLDDLGSRLLPVPSPEEPPTVSSKWRTSHVSADSFFQNKHGVSQRRLWSSGSLLFRRQYHSPLRDVCSELQFLPVLLQSRGFKTLRRKTRRMESSYDGPVQSEAYIPAFLKGLLLRDIRAATYALEQVAQQKNLPENQQEAFKMGFTDGFMRAQSLTQKTKVSQRRTRVILLAVLLIGMFGLSKTQFFSGKGSFADAGWFWFLFLHIHSNKVKAVYAH